MNINNFEHCFSYSNDLLGSSLFSHGHVISHKKNGNAFQFLIEGKRKKPYRVNVEITPTGDITTLTCDCSHPVTDQRCAHEFAALLRMNEIYEEEISTESSGGLSDLIRLYQNQAVPEDEVKAHLELEWTFEGSLCYRLKIGTERTYVIKNFDRFIRDFNDNATRSYGKFFSFTHNLKNLDAFSKQLFQLTVEIYYESRYDYRNRYSSSEGFFYPIGSHLEELLEMYPNLSAKEREDEICRKYGAVFIIGIGGKLANGEPHDGRAPDYDDWSTVAEDGRKGLNGDILIWYPVLERSLELSSMGVRVDAESLLRQLEMSGKSERSKLYFHKQLLEGNLPLSIGGGIGQSRLCMMLLQKAHIGEIQASIWSDEMRQECKQSGMPLI